MPKPILAISYAFPPLSAPEAFLSAKTLGALKPFEVDLLCAAPSTRLLSLDRSLDRYVQERFRNLYPIEFSAIFAALFSRSFIREVVLGLSHFPDRAAWLNAPAFEKVISLGLENYSCLFTWSQFHSSHLLGLKLKKRFPQVPWVAHLSDPWADNPFFRWPALMGPLQRLMEKKVFESADALVFTSEKTVELILRHYPKEYRKKCFVIPHPYDLELYPPQSKSTVSTTSNPKVIRYLGRFYGERNPLSLLLALDILLEREPSLLEGIQLEFYGCGSGFPGEKQLRHPKYVRWVKVFPSCDYRTSLKLMREADLLLIIDAPFEETVFLPSKLVDAMGAESSIFGITPEGTSKEVIQSLGGTVVHPSNIQGIADALRNEICRIRSGYLVEFGKARERFSLSSVADLTKKCLERVGVKF